MAVSIFPMVLLFIVAGIIFRLIAGTQDHNRIKDYVERDGGEVINVSWTPLGPGWAGEKSDRIYYVTYRDSQGNLHQASCKTSMFSGVYFTRDTIAEATPAEGTEPLQPLPADSANLMAQVKSLKEENDRLRQEIEKSRGPLM